MSPIDCVDLNRVFPGNPRTFTLLKKGIMEQVRRGETLSVLTDVFGETSSEVVAPFDGIVLGFWSVPVIQPGDGSYLYGKILD